MKQGWNPERRVGTHVESSDFRMLLSSIYRSCCHLQSKSSIILPLPLFLIFAEALRRMKQARSTTLSSRMAAPARVIITTTMPDTLPVPTREPTGASVGGATPGGAQG